LISLALWGCGGGGGAGAGLVDQAPSQIGAPNQKPGTTGQGVGSYYLVDPHLGGQASALRLVNLSWGRLVDIQEQPNGFAEPRLVYADFVIGDDVRTEVGKWTLGSNPVTGRQILTIQRLNTPEPNDSFDALVDEARANLGPIFPKGVALNETPPFSYIARNAALVLQFDDLLDLDSLSLNDSVRIEVGNPPVTPFDVRILPDSNFGGISPLDGRFHSTRLILDMTISASEQLLLPETLALNGAGLPASLEPLKANVALRIPTVSDPSVGQFELLTNLKGRPLASSGNGPVDLSSSTQDVVRAMRSGNGSDLNNGFLSDLEGPRLLGRQGIQITSASPDPSGQPGYDFLLGFAFESPTCSISPALGDSIQVGTKLELSVAQAGAASQGSVAALRVRLPVGAEPVTTGDLIGAGQLVTPWRAGLAASLAPCFVRYSPSPEVLPSLGLLPNSRAVVEFSEAIDPLSVRPFDSFMIKRGPNQATFRDLIVGEILASADLREFTFAPLLPLSHQEGVPEVYFVELVSSLGQGGVRDLAGNVLQTNLPEVSFSLAPAEPSQFTSGFALRFNAVSEDDNPGQDLRGQFLYSLAQGQIRPRPFTRFGAVIDRTVPIIGKMQIVQSGLQTPLSNLGSKLHIMWRYADMGLPLEFNQEDVFANIDVVGIALAPKTGSVTATFYPQFEMLLGHSDRLPDEITNQSNDPTYQFSGFNNDATFAQNYLADALNVPAVVHPKELGFLVSSSEVFTTSTGSTMVHFPLNRTVAPEDRRYYTWRDTAIQGWGGRNVAGTNLANAGVPITWDVQAAGGAVPADVGIEYGGPNAPNQVTPPGIPSIGLPLLMEFRCFPGESLSVNNFDVSIASTSNIRPFFRAFSTGGFNPQGQPVIKDPDAQVSPTGGFNGNPLLGQLGSGTPPRDPTVYLGQLDLVTRIARAHTVLFNTQQADPDYAGVVIEPRSNLQPAGTQILIAFRGDDSANLPATSQYFDGAQMDVYGDPLNATNANLVSNFTWSSNISANDGNRYLQMRLTFVSNPLTELSPVLSGLGVAWRF
jgi:hypothetical protein